MSRSTATIDDAGFSEPYTRAASSPPAGDPKPTAGTPQPERTAEGTAGKIAGFESVSPFEFDIVDRSGDTGSGDSGDTGGRRGRPRGSRNRPKETTPPNLANLEDILFSIHLMMSGMVQEFALEKSECKDYSEALKEVAKHYAIAVDPKKMAMINLAAVMGRLYIPRGIATYQRIKRESRLGKPAEPIRPPLATAPAKPATPPVNGIPVVDLSQSGVQVPVPKKDPAVIEVPSQIWDEGGEYVPPVD